ncbi:MAG: HDOD domain-containing protein [Myxococcales bacterium]|nr:HDOD domain-containing protein [Myxococcales bacterium]
MNPSLEMDMLVAQGRSLGSLPDVFQRLTRVLEDPAANARTIAETVRIDPGLTAGVLGLANSAAYSPRSRVKTVAHAAAMLGSRRLREVALATSVVSMFRGMPEHLLSMRSFWRHSVAVGLCAQSLAAQAWRDAEETFVAGLLHDVGTLLLCLVEPTRARRVFMELENAQRAQVEVELDVLGFHHAELGARLLESWGLSHLPVAVARWHHAPSEAPEDVRSVADLVHVADVVVSALQLGNAGERLAHGLDAAAWDRIPLDLDDMEDTLASLQHELDDVSDALCGGLAS